MDGGRKWTLAVWTFKTATVFAGLAFLWFVSKGLEPMSPLYWWTSATGGLILLYNGSNIVGKKVNSDPVP